MKERGSVTVFVVVFAVALLAMAGLVIDGGRILAAHQRAFDEAEAAARSGVQAIDGGALRATGVVTLDATEAQRRAEDYLAANGRHGSVEVVGDAVDVHVSFVQPLAILGAFGLGPVTVQGDGHARAVRGVVEGEAP